MTEEPEMPVELTPSLFVLPSAIARVRIAYEIVRSESDDDEEQQYVAVNSTAVYPQPGQSGVALAKEIYKKIFGEGEAVWVSYCDWVRPELVGEILVSDDGLVYIDGGEVEPIHQGEDDQGNPTWENTYETAERVWRSIWPHAPVPMTWRASD